MAPEVLVPILEFHLILEHIKHSTTPQTLVRKGGCYLMPRKLLLEILHRYDMWEIQQSMFFNRPASTQAIHGVPRRPMLWKRLKVLSPKNISVLSCIKNSKGNLVTAPRDIDQATRDTRTFWEDTPQPLPDSLIATLREYQAESPPFPPLPPPPHAHHMSSIDRTGDSAPGVDGIPCAVLRVLPSKFAQLMEWWIDDLLLDEPTLRPPQQLLVGIPKNDT